MRSLTQSRYANEAGGIRSKYTTILLCVLGCFTQGTGDRRQVASVHRWPRNDAPLVDAQTSTMGLIWILLVVCLVPADTKPTTRDDSRKILVLLIDGFRWDYFDLFDDGELTGFEAMMDKGVKAEFIQSTFPTLSFVNYYSLMTGLYGGSHGMVNNYMYDVIHDSEFLIGDNRPEQDQAFWWDDGEPLWITGAKQGKRSHMWFWNGCEVEIRGYRPAFCAAYQNNPNPSIDLFRQGVQEAVRRLGDDVADFAGVYFEKIDHYGHTEGPGGPTVLKYIRDVDTVLTDLQGWVKSNDLEDNLDIIMFSDHGMAQLTGDTAIINLLDYISMEDIFQAVNSKSVPVMQIWPAEGKLEEVYAGTRNAHANMTVYLREDIPDRYHLKEHYRNPPLLMVADEGFTILKPNNTHNSYRGFHGYDNDMISMRGIFLAQGPDFKKNYIEPGFINIEVYNLMCCLLGIEPAPNNGTLSNIVSMVEEKSPCLSTSSAGSRVYGLSMLVSLLYFMVILL